MNVGFRGETVDLRGEEVIDLALCGFCSVVVCLRGLLMREEEAGGREGVLFGDDAIVREELMKREAGALFGVVNARLASVSALTLAIGA